MSNDSKKPPGPGMCLGMSPSVAGLGKRDCRGEVAARGKHQFRGFRDFEDQGPADMWTRVWRPGQGKEAGDSMEKQIASNSSELPS